MKFHNIAFGFGGIMAMIFGVMGAARADTTTTIASQAYVDAKLGTKQDALSNTQLNAVNSGVTSTQVGLVNNATDSNVIATATANTNLLKASGLQSGVLHMKGTGTTGYVSNVNNNAASDTGSVKNATVSANAKTAWDGVFSSKYGDNFVPSVASVERRIQEAVSGAAPSSATTSAAGIVTLDTATSASYSNGALTLTAASTDGNQTNKVATTSQVRTTASNIKDYIDYKAAGALARKDAVGTADITDKSVQYQFDMNNNALFDINTGAVPSGDYCTESIPCVLTYFKKGSKMYTRWSPMDLDGANINSSTTDAGASL